MKINGKLHAEGFRLYNRQSFTAQISVSNDIVRDAI